MSVNDAYNQMATSGLYGKPPGLKGKYDNVRRFWEDKVTAYFLRPFLEEVKKNCLESGRKVRILDLGCGSGDGYELLTEVVNHDASPGKVKVNVLPEDEIDLYVGVDLNSELLAQGRGYFGNCDNVRFLKGNFLQGLGVEDEPPFDIYLANYGTLSHCDDREVEELLGRIIKHGGESTIFMGDWLGAYSYEWQNLWVNPLEEDYTLPYVVSYLYEEEERKDLEAFHMRLMDRPTLFSIINKVAHDNGAELKVLRVFDRSLLVGRHMETGEYYDYPQKIRSAVNSLLEPECRTDLREVKVKYQPAKGYDVVNDYFKRLETAWNNLVEIAENVLAGDYYEVSVNGHAELEGEIGEYTQDIDEFLSLSAKTLTRLMQQSQNLPVEDVRANIIEPQLAYLLRRAEMVFQEGQGMGHGFTAILEIVKK